MTNIFLDLNNFSIDIKCSYKLNKDIIKYHSEYCSGKKKTLNYVFLKFERDKITDLKNIIVKTRIFFCLFTFY